MKSGNLVNGDQLPLGFGMALAQNPKAMDVFAAMPQKQREDVIRKTETIRSKEEMRSYVDCLVGLTPPAKL